MSYKTGTKLLHKESGICGTVVENFKLPGDICVEWQGGLVASYDEDFLKQISEIITENNHDSN